MIFVDIGRDTPSILENIHFFLGRNLENHPANRCFCKNRFFQDDTAWSQATHISNLRWLEWHAALKISITSTSHPTIPKQLPGPPGACTAQLFHLSIPCLALGFEGNLGKHPGFRYFLRGGGDEHHKNPGWIAHWSLEDLEAKYPTVLELVWKGWTIHVSNLSIWNQIKTKSVHEWVWGFMKFHGSAKTLVAP